jgi:hypothetical protein
MFWNVGTLLPNYAISHPRSLHSSRWRCSLAALPPIHLSYELTSEKSAPGRKHLIKTMRQNRLIQILPARWCVVAVLFWSLISWFICFKHGGSVIGRCWNISLNFFLPPSFPFPMFTLCNFALVTTGCSAKQNRPFPAVIDSRGCFCNFWKSTLCIIIIVFSLSQQIAVSSLLLST